MRELLSLLVAALVAVPMVSCDEQPTQISQQETPEISAHQSDAPHPIAGVRTWADNSDMWEFLVPQPVSPASENATAPLWVIDPVDDADSPHATLFFGPHDHVVPAQAQNGGEFSAMWHVHLVTDGQGNLVNSADIDSDPDEELLTSHARIQKAVDMGLVTSAPVDGAIFPCPVRSLR